MVVLPTLVFRAFRFKGSPAGASKSSAGVLGSEGGTPAVTPPSIGDSSWIVSLPEKTVSLSCVAAAAVDFSRHLIRAGLGRYSYCQPVSRFVVEPAVRLVVPTSCVISASSSSAIVHGNPLPRRAARG